MYVGMSSFNKIKHNTVVDQALREHHMIENKTGLSTGPYVFFYFHLCLITQLYHYSACIRSYRKDLPRLVRTEIYLTEFTICIALLFCLLKLQAKLK